MKTKICKICDKDFTFKRTRALYCSKECRKYSQTHKCTTLEKFFKEKINRIKSNSKKRKIDFDIIWKDLYNQYIKQSGKCYYTGFSLDMDYSNEQYKNCPPFQLSVDRIDSDKGYKKENIVLCCYCINNFKNDHSNNILKLYFDKIYQNQGKFYNEIAGF